MIRSRIASSRTAEVRLEGRSDALQIRGWIPAGAAPVEDCPTYLLIHGLGLSHRPYGRLARELAEHGRVIGLDLPGFGGLSRPIAPVSVSDYAEVISAWLDRNNVEGYVAIGHSMGAQIALELTLRDPARAQALIVIGPVVDPERRTLIQQAVALARDIVKEPLSTNLLVFRDYVTCGTSWFLAEAREMIAYCTDLRVLSLTVPLLALRGEHDNIAPRQWCAWLADAAQIGATASLARQRHVMVVAEPREVATRIVAFVESLGRIRER